MFLQICITQNYQKNRNKTGNITQTKITGIFTTLRTIIDQQLFRSMSIDALECIEVFSVAYTCFNLNLEMFAETQGHTGNIAVCPFSVIENTITKLRFDDESFMF
jgi:hypothetical protein